MASRLKCKFCGRGFLAKPYSRNGQTMTCKRAKCEKQAGIYAAAKIMAKHSNDSMTPLEKTMRGRRGAEAADAKYGPDRMKKVRAGKKLTPVKE